MVDPTKSRLSLYVVFMAIPTLNDDELHFYTNYTGCSCYFFQANTTYLDTVITSQ